jgi:sugar phosphate permease
VNPSSRHHPWLIVAVLFLVSATAYADRIALSALFPLLRQDLGLSDLQLGLIGSAFLWAYGIGCALGGFLSDRASRSRIVLVSLTLWSVATLAVAWVQGFEQLVWARIAFGAAQCLYIPAALALIADHHGPATRGKAISSNLAGMSIGLIGGATLAGLIAQSLGWREVFTVFGLGGLVLAGLTAWIVRDAPPAAAAEGVKEPSLSLVASFRLLFGTRTYYLILLQGMAASMGAWMFWNWLPLYYQETFQMSLAGAGFSGTFMLQATAMVGIVLGGVISDRVGRSHAHRRPLVMAGFYCAAAPFLLVFLFEPGFLLVSVCLAASSLLRTMGQANENLILCDLLPARVRSAALGIFLFGNVSAGSVAILVAAWIRGFAGLSTAFACVAGLIGISALAAAVAYRVMPGDLARLPARLARLEGSATSRA